jgi:UDP-4-amino-4,6-dideoxy-N-acetyl-beta-L-altrosamine N-acetyltransferase
MPRLSLLDVALRSPAARRENAMRIPFLIGSTTYLRPLEREDAAIILPWVNDPEVTRHLLLHRPINLRAEEDYIDRLYQSEQDVYLGIAIRKDDRLIGGCALHRIDAKNRSTSFGIFLGDKDSWGRGHGTEATRLLVGYAFETLNLNRVWLHVFEDNAGAIRCYEKVGFQREGLLRQDYFRAGRYWNTVVMGILREEWQPVTA